MMGILLPIPESGAYAKLDKYYKDWRNGILYYIIDSNGLSYIMPEASLIPTNCPICYGTGMLQWFNEFIKCPECYNDYCEFMTETLKHIGNIMLEKCITKKTPWYKRMFRWRKK